MNLIKRLKTFAEDIRYVAVYVRDAVREKIERDMESLREFQKGADGARDNDRLN